MSLSETFPTSPLIDHLRDLRRGLIRGLIAVIACSSVGCIFANPIYQFLIEPLIQALPPGSTLIAIHPIEAWLTYLKTGVLTGFFLAAPYLFLLTWQFVAPGLYAREKKLVISCALSFGVLFTTGAVFGYTVVFPIGFKALVSILGNTSVQLLPTMEHSFSFLVGLLLAFGLAFELPLIVMGLSAAGIVPYEKWKACRQYSIVAALIVGGILTPPDPITQILMAIPLLLLFELGLLGAKILRGSPLKIASKANSNTQTSQP